MGSQTNGCLGQAPFTAAQAAYINFNLKNGELMDIIIKAGNVGIDMESGDIEITDVDALKLIKAIKEYLEIEELFKLIYKDLPCGDWDKIVAWLDETYDINCLINEGLDDIERSEEILEQLKIDIAEAKRLIAET